METCPSSHLQAQRSFTMPETLHVYIPGLPSGLNTAPSAALLELCGLVIPCCDPILAPMRGLFLQVSVPNGAPAKARTGPVPHKYDMAFQYLWNAEHIWSKVRGLCATAPARSAICISDTSIVSEC